MDGKIVNWGVISCAGIAYKRALPGLVGAENSKLYAISSRTNDKIEQFKQKFGELKSYLSYDELLDDPEIDAVYIPLPNSLHYEWVLKAAEKKKHVFCEKPMGVTAQEVREMKAACDKNGVLLMEAFPYRHSPLTKTVKSLVAEGAIGKLKFVESHFSYMLDDLTNVRLRKDVAGGATYDMGCYNIDLIRHMIGSKPTSILAMGDIGKESGVDETTLIAMEFGGGVRALAYTSFKSTTRSDYTLVGETGVIHVPVTFNSKGETSFILKTKTPDGMDVKEIKVDCPDNYTLEFEQFANCILGREKPLMTYEESLADAEILDEALRQVREKNK